MKKTLNLYHVEVNHHWDPRCGRCRYPKVEPFTVKARSPHKAAEIALDVIEEDHPKAFPRVICGGGIIECYEMWEPENGEEGYVPVMEGAWFFRTNGGKLRQQ